MGRFQAACVAWVIVCWVPNPFTVIPTFGERIPSNVAEVQGWLKSGIGMRRLKSPPCSSFDNAVSALSVVVVSPLEFVEEARAAKKRPRSEPVDEPLLEVVLVEPPDVMVLPRTTSKPAPGTAKLKRSELT